MPKNATILERWLEKVALGDLDDCWPWMASRDPDGYGRFQYPTPSGQVHTRAHRWIVEHLRGPIPAGHVVMHTCDSPPCVNPAHLTIGTPLDNNADKVAKGRHAVPWGTPLARSRQTHCKRGHPLEGDNLAVVDGNRRCKACGALLSRRSYRRKRGLPGDGQPRPPREVTVGRGHS